MGAASKNGSMAQEFTLPLIELDMTGQVLISVVFALFSISIIFSNSLIIAIFLKDKSVRKHMNFLYIINLSVCDLLIGVFVLPMTTVYVVSGHWSWGRDFCMAYLILTFWLFTENNLTLFLMGYDMLIKTKYAMEYHSKVSRAQILVHIGVSWVLSFLYYTLFLVLWTDDDHTLTTGQCLWPFRESSMFTFLWPNLLYAFVFGGSVIIGHRVFKHIKSRADRMADGEFSDSSDETLDSDKSSAKYLIVLTLPYLTMWSLIHVIFVADALCWCLGYASYMACLVLLALVSLFNPVLYAYRKHDRLRLQAKRILCFWRRHQIDAMLQATHDGPSAASTSSANGNGSAATVRISKMSGPGGQFHEKKFSMRKKN